MQIPTCAICYGIYVSYRQTVFKTLKWHGVLIVHLFFFFVVVSQHLLQLQTVFVLKPTKAWACTHQSTQMASQKLRETSNVLRRNMNQYILTRIKCASVEPFGLSKTALLLMSNLFFIFVFTHAMIRCTAVSFWRYLPDKKMMMVMTVLNFVWQWVSLSRTRPSKFSLTAAAFKAVKVYPFVSISSIMYKKRRGGSMILIYHHIKLYCKHNNKPLFIQVRKWRTLLFSTMTCWPLGAWYRVFTSI